MKKRNLRKLILAATLALTVGGLYACDKSSGQTFRSGDYTLEASLSPDPPVVGENRVEIRLLDSAGVPVTGAMIRVRAFMPAMGAMPAMEAKGKGEELGDGRYGASFSLAMSGNWDFTIKAEKGGAILAAFDLQIAPPRPGLVDPGGGSDAASGGHQHGSAPMAASSGTSQLSVPEPRSQLIGVRTSLVETRELSRPIRTVGRVEVDETRLWHVTLKYSGWIEKLFVDFTGAFVEKGQPLFTLYSQELYVSQQEYLDALNAYRDGQASKALVDAARERLALWDLTGAQIRELEKRGKADKYLTIYSPTRGYVVNKMAVEGHEVRPGMRLYEIADLSRVWVIADVYEYEVSLVKVGNVASITDAYTQGPPRKGLVDYIYPHVDIRSRTLPVRVVFENPTLALKPGMYVNVQIESPLGPRVAVPEQAVLYSGEHRYVFVDLGGGRLDPREIHVSEKSGDYYSVVSGLRPGDRVVTSANFLISSEAQLKGALPKWKSDQVSIRDAAPTFESMNHPGQGNSETAPMDMEHSSHEGAAVPAAHDDMDHSQHRKNMAPDLESTDHSEHQDGMPTHEGMDHSQHQQMEGAGR